MRLAFFGTRGPLTLEPLRAVAREHEVVAFVRPAPEHRGVRSMLRRGARKLGLGAPDPLGDWARAHGCELLGARGRRDPRLIERLAELELDLICISTFRWVLDEELFSLPSLGAVNLHASLLPRHRGANPFFWLYREDDREAGVTLHRVDRGADTGPILGQEAFELPRGTSVEWTGARCAELGAELLAASLPRLASGDLVASPQDEARATRAPMTDPGTRAVDFERWDVERVWHFLAGLYPRFVEPLEDGDGRRVLYGGVTGFERCEARRVPGSLRRTTGRGNAGWELACQGGVVHLSGGPLRAGVA